MQVVYVHVFQRDRIALPVLDQNIRPNLGRMPGHQVGKVDDRRHGGKVDILIPVRRVEIGDGVLTKPTPEHEHIAAVPSAQNIVV